MNYWRWIYLIGLALFSTIAQATLYPSTRADSKTLIIHSATDEQAILPALLDFQSLHPEVSIEYLDLGTLPLMQRFLSDAEQQQTADVIISSAMDLQIKLINDGYAVTHESETTQLIPDWAKWRKQAYSFTYEPVVIVYNQRLLPADKVPKNRFDLINLLRDEQEFFLGRIGTYNIETSGLGYLLASQDAEQTSTWGRLTENFSHIQFKGYDNTQDMLNAVQSGELLLAYNVLGSYALSAMKKHPDLAILFPSDYTLVVSRVAFISKYANHPGPAHWFMDYLLSQRGQKLLAEQASLYSLHPAITGEATYQSIQKLSREQVPLKVIKLSPALLTYQDQLKKRKFIEEWRKLLPNENLPTTTR
ncbi:MAG: ABC transporter substrate-binding protein [Thiothrix sp.]|nr:MAG: ABC transporter substrate-binding protein [Thiothrix sp.]